MHLLEQMAASDEDNRLDAAVSIIKAEQEHRMEFVKPYGLEHSVQNRYYVMYHGPGCCFLHEPGFVFWILPAA